MDWEIETVYLIIISQHCIALESDYVENTCSTLR